MAQQIGLPPRNLDTLDYTGRSLYATPCFQAPRDPTVNDKAYPIETIWRNEITQKQWILVGFSAITGGYQANWMPLTGGSSPALITFQGGAGTTGFPVSPDGLGNVTLTSILGTVVITGTPNTINFDITGGGVGIDTINVDAATAPGVTAVTADATGNVAVNGAIVAAHSVPVQTRSLALHQYDIDVQQTSAVAASDGTKSGLAHFDSAVFTADASGFVSLTGGAIPPSQTFTVDAVTAPGVNPVTPSATGNVIINGAVVAAHSVPVQTRSLALHQYDIDVQQSAAVAASDGTKSGLAHFDSADFTVDASGFVSLNGTGIFLWQTISANQALAVNHGYICISPGGALSLSLPAASALGDEIEITLDGATSFAITQAAGQQIRIGNIQTTAGVGGSITTTASGDTIRMVCQTANLKWNILSTVGNFTVV